MISVKYNKAVTIIEEFYGSVNVKTLKSKTDFYTYIKDADSFDMIISVNANPIITKLINLGFKAEINEDYGFDWELKITFNK